ncbi:MAG: NADH-quinone oxidoreductase subunit [Campylobacterota bacterium]|nr:NADH-quinone oxidoreductase subunit [Campylobacterota bacterium]
MEAIAFYTFSALTIVMFYITVTTNNALYALSALAAGMIFISGFFFLLDAEFLGVVQLVVYSGAVMALYAFGMMFFDSTKIIKENTHSAKTVFVLSGLSALLIVAIFAAPIIADNVVAVFPPNESVGNTENIGYVLFTKYLIPFELAAVMLLVAMVVGIVLASKKMDLSVEEDA